MDSRGPYKGTTPDYAPSTLSTAQTKYVKLGATSEIGGSTGGHRIEKKKSQP